jgi:GntR family transcriptional regulator
LAHALVINPTTVVKAFAELERDGVLEIKQGRGAFVGTKATAMSDRERDKALRRLARQLVVEAAQMGVTLETALQAVQREWAPLRGGSGEPDASQPSEPEGQGKLPE